VAGSHRAELAGRLDPRLDQVRPAAFHLPDAGAHAFVRTGDADDTLERERAQARDTARRFGLRYEEIEGSRDLVRPLLFGPWDERFIVVPVGGTVRLNDFLERS